MSSVCLRYVAAQGPLPQTCTHFWQTVWEQQIHTIIMLTTLTERGRVYILLHVHTFTVQTRVSRKEILSVKSHSLVSAMSEHTNYFLHIITCCFIRYIITVVTSSNADVCTQKQSIGTVVSNNRVSRCGGKLNVKCEQGGY